MLLYFFASVLAYPLPFAGKINLQFNAVNKGKADIRILNINGAEVAKLGTHAEEGLNDVHMNGLDRLAPGFYMARIFIDNKLIGSQKIIK